MKAIGSNLLRLAKDIGPPHLRRCRHARLLALACFALGCALVPVFPKVQAQVRDDRAVKAAFVYNLTKYVEWPQLSDDIVIGIISQDSTGEFFKAILDGKSSESRTIRILLSPSDQDLQRCNLVYVAGAQQNNLRAALDRIRKKGVLTVGEAEFFTREGGMIGLVTVGDHVQIQVNLQQTRESGLKISSRLLSIAVVSQAGSGRD